MKNRIKTTLKLTLICSLFFFLSCEKELYEQSIKKNKTSKTEMLRGKEAEKVALRIKKILNSQNSLNSNEFARTISLNIGNISYDEILKIIDTYGKENYTLKIELPEETDLKFANLVLQEKDSYTTIKVIEYNMTEQFAQHYKLNKDITQFQGTIKFTPIFSDDPCPDPEIIINVQDIPANNGGGGAWNGYIPAEGAGTGGAPGGGGTAGIYQYVYVIIVPISDFSETSPTNTNGNNTGAPNWIYWNPPVFNRLAIKPVNPAEPCAPDTEIGILVPLEECSKNFLNELNDEQQAWMYQQQSNNAPIYNDILYYVAGDENGCNAEKNTFVKEALNGIVSDSIGVFKPETFDNNIVSNLPPCLKNVIDDLKSLQNGKFGEIIKLFAQPNPAPLNYNWTINTASLGQNVTASTEPSIQPGNIALTTINSDYTSISTDLSIAKTLIHECFHAYLTSIYRYQNYDMSYINLLNKYIAQFGYNANVIHHYLFTKDNIVSQISLALKEYGLSKGYNLPQQFYDDMAWGGLYGTDVYQDLPETDKDRIESTIEAEFRNSSNSPNNVLNYTPKGVVICP